MLAAQDIKGMTDIRQVVAEHYGVKLRQRGKEWVGLCPFHDDRRPSLSVNSDKGVFLCRSCGKGGDVLDFIQQKDGVDFPGALRILAGIAGVPLEGLSAPVVRPVEFSLAEQETAPFDRWLYLRRNRLIALLRKIEDDRNVALRFVEQFWNADYLTAADRQAVDAAHRRLTALQEAEAHTTAKLDELDWFPDLPQFVQWQLADAGLQPENLVETFLREFYDDSGVHELLMENL